MYSELHAGEPQRKRACLRVVLQHYAPAGPVVGRRKMAIPWETGHTVTLGFHTTASGTDGRDALHSEKGNREMRAGDGGQCR